jgi:hypothetical protein
VTTAFPPVMSDLEFHSLTINQLLKLIPGLAMQKMFHLPIFQKIPFQNLKLTVRHPLWLIAEQSTTNWISQE